MSLSPRLPTRNVADALIGSTIRSISPHLVREIPRGTGCVISAIPSAMTNQRRISFEGIGSLRVPAARAEMVRAVSPIRALSPGQVIATSAPSAGFARCSPATVVTAYLPKAVNGRQALEAVGEQTWQSIKFGVHAFPGTQGLAYRREKQVDTKMEEYLRWGETIQGVDEGDGWVRVQVQVGKPRRISRAVVPPTSVAGSVGQAAPLRRVRSTSPLKSPAAVQKPLSVRAPVLQPATYHKPQEFVRRTSYDTLPIGGLQSPAGFARSRSSSPATVWQDHHLVPLATAVGQKPLSMVPPTDVRLQPHEIDITLRLRQEKIVEVPEVSVVEAVKQVPRVEIKKVPKQVGKIIPEVVQHQIEVPVALKVEKIVEVPEVQTIDVIKSVPRPHLQQVEKRIPKMIFDTRERIIEQEQLLMAEEILEVPEIIRESVRIEVAQPETELVERMVEIPVNEYVERVVEVPAIMDQECFAEVVEPFRVELTKQLPLREQQRIDKEVAVQDIQYVEKIVEVPHIVYQERINKIPEIVYKEVVKEVPKYEIKYVDRYVEKEVIEYIEKVVEVPHVVYHERPCEVPEIRKITARTQKPAVAVSHVRRNVPVVRLQCREKVVEVPVPPLTVEKVVPVDVTQAEDVIVQIGKAKTEIIEREVPSVTTLRREKIVEVPARMEEERIVEIPEVKVVEFARQVVKEVHQTVPVKIPRIENHIVEKVVPVRQDLVQMEIVEVPQVRKVDYLVEECDGAVEQFVVHRGMGYERMVSRETAVHERTLPARELAAAQRVREVPAVRHVDQRRMPIAQPALGYQRLQYREEVVDQLATSIDVANDRYLLPVPAQMLEPVDFELQHEQDVAASSAPLLTATTVPAISWKDQAEDEFQDSEVKRISPELWSDGAMEQWRNIDEQWSQVEHLDRLEQTRQREEQHREVMQRFEKLREQELEMEEARRRNEEFIKQDIREHALRLREQTQQYEDRLAGQRRQDEETIKQDIREHARILKEQTQQYEDRRLEDEAIQRHYRQQISEDSVLVEDQARMDRERIEDLCVTRAASSTSGASPRTAPPPEGSTRTTPLSKNRLEDGADFYRDTMHMYPSERTQVGRLAGTVDEALPAASEYLSGMTAEPLNRYDVM